MGKRPWNKGGFHRTDRPDTSYKLRSTLIPGSPQKLPVAKSGSEDKCKPCLLCEEGYCKHHKCFAHLVKALCVSMKYEEGGQNVKENTCG